MNPRRTVFFVSDGTGITAQMLGHSLLTQFYRYVCETPNRVPIADIYFAHTGRRRANQARSVVGRFFMKLLADQLAQSRTPARHRSESAAQPDIRDLASARR